MTLKKTLFILLVLFGANKLKAQDTLYKTNGSKIIAKITEINSTEIKYKMLGSDSDLLITENKNNIHHIVYANGSKEFYNTLVPQPKQEPTDYIVKTDGTPIRSVGEKVYGKNILAINFFETFFTNFGFSYERVSADGKFSVKIPFSFGLGGRQNQNIYNPNNYSFGMDYLTNKIYGTGLELNAYPVKFNRGGFYIGLTGEYGTFNYFTNMTQNYPYYYSGLEKHIGIHYAGLFHIGGNIGLTDKIILGGKIALGYKHEETVFVDYTRFKMSFDMNLAYRF